MFRFGEPIYLYLLLILPILVILYLYSNYRRRKKIRQYGDPELLAHCFCSLNYGYFYVGTSSVRF